jgi:hypothetical protein
MKFGLTIPDNQIIIRGSNRSSRPARLDILNLSLLRGLDGFETAVAFQEQEA